MRRIALRSLLRLSAVVAALACGWVAIATAQRAYVPACGVEAVKGIVREGQHVPVVCGSAQFGMVWRPGPTIAMGVAIVAAIGLALLAIVPRQGLLLAYRWRRAVY